MSTGFGIVGTGMISHFHAKAIAEITGASVVACCDTIEERATSFADEYGCRAYTNIDDMLADADVHIVNVCTPSGAHRDLAVSAANAAWPISPASNDAQAILPIPSPQSRKK